MGVLAELLDNTYKPVVISREVRNHCLYKHLCYHLLSFVIRATGSTGECNNVHLYTVSYQEGERWNSQIWQNVIKINDTKWNVDKIIVLLKRGTRGL